MSRAQSGCWSRWLLFAEACLLTDPELSRAREKLQVEFFREALGR